MIQKKTAKTLKGLREKLPKAALKSKKGRLVVGGAYPWINNP